MYDQKCGPDQPEANKNKPTEAGKTLFFFQYFTIGQSLKVLTIYN